MKTRKKFIDNVRQMYAQHEDAIQIAGIAILLIAIFIAGYLVSWNFLEKPLNDGQFEFCEQVARDVYAQKGQVIVEAPEDVSVATTTTTITVKLADGTYRGYVVAKLQNGELVMTRNFETGDAIFTSILMGILFICVFVILVLIGDKIYKKIKR